MSENTRKAPAGEAGFTLVETLVAIVVLVFGLIAVTNLLVVAGTSNQVANAATGAAMMAHRQMDLLKATSYPTMTLGGSVTADVSNFFREDMLPGVGPIHTRWAVSAVSGDNQVRFVQVRAYSTSPLLRTRSQADFSTFRACTVMAAPINCPAP